MNTTYTIEGIFGAGYNRTLYWNFDENTFQEQRSLSCETDSLEHAQSVLKDRPEKEFCKKYQIVSHTFDENEDDTKVNILEEVEGDFYK